MFTKISTKRVGFLLQVICIENNNSYLLNFSRSCDERQICCCRVSGGDDGLCTIFVHGRAGEYCQLVFQVDINAMVCY